MTGYRLKVVKRAGAKLEDLLRASVPWRGEDCGRELCRKKEKKERENQKTQIQENAKHNLLNSKSEFKRCAVLRLTSKLGNKLYRKWEEDEREDMRNEAILWDRIRKLRKENNKVRRKNDEADHQEKD